jgi:hypothetical protein
VPLAIKSPGAIGHPFDAWCATIWPNVQYILKSSEFVRRDGEGSVLFDTRAADGRRPEPWTTHWSKPLPPHSIENVGETELRVIMIELKDHPAGGRAS